MGIPGYGSPYIAHQRPFGGYSLQGGGPSYGLTNPTDFPSLQSQGDLFSPTSTALDFSSPGSFTGVPMQTAGNPFMASFSPKAARLTTTKGFDEEDGTSDPGTESTDGAEDTSDTSTDGDGKDDKKKMKMSEYLNLILFCRRPDGSVDFNAFFAKYCDDDEKPVKVRQAEDLTFGNYEEG